jgi:hypothetical protein
VFLTVPNLKSGGLLVYIARMTPLLQLVDFISGKKSGQVTRRTLARAYPTMLFMIWCVNTNIVSRIPFGLYMYMCNL